VEVEEVLMWRRSALAAVAIVLQIFCGVVGAKAQDSEIDCDSFLKNSDGSWTVIKKVFIPVQNVRVVEGTVFRPGQTFLGDDMTVRLARACPNKAVTQPDSATPNTPQVPTVPLSIYADANGNIDVQRLTCAHLNAASPEEVGLLLDWYSGWYNGRAKRPGINVARVRYATSSLTNYCKAYPATNLAQAMELLLK
jgi:HdeA/HdeB family